MTPHQRLFSNCLGAVSFIRTKQNSQPTTEQFLEVILELIYELLFRKWAGFSRCVLGLKNLLQDVFQPCPSSHSILPPIPLSLAVSSHCIILINSLPFPLPLHHKLTEGRY